MALNQLIPSDYDAKLSISVAPDTMIFISAIIIIYLASKKKGVL